MVRIKKMDNNGHSCLAEKNGMAEWVPGDADVSLDLAENVVRQHLKDGYLLVDEEAKSIVGPEKLKGGSSFVLMPPVVGG
jgi:hypothetical protein